jgi:methyl-accepting chemotaxis protein
MKLGTKLPLTFAVILALVLAAALFGIYSLSRSLNSYETEVRSSMDNERMVGDVTIAFKVQVQEWKNILIRGKRPSDFEKHWSAFLKQEQIVSDGVGKLQRSMPEGSAKTLIDRFAQAHVKLGQSYRVGLDAFKASGFDALAGDAAVAGIDREPVKLLDEVGQQIGADSAKVSTQVAAESKRATIVSVCLMLLASVIGIIAGVALGRTVIRQLGGEPSDAASLARSVAAGDLSVSIAVQQGDTTSLMAQLKIMQASLARVVNIVRQNSESIATASTQIADGNNNLSQRTEEQASALEQTSASMQELSTSVQRNSDSAKHATKLAADASTVAAKGGAVVGQVVETMRGINESSNQISDIIAVIDGIAFQTNILALNAAVEAARAGDQGRGFAVVASEVRALAQRSASAAKEIRSLISASVERVGQGSELVGQAGATMNEIVTSIERVAVIMNEISSAGAQQSASVAEVTHAVQQMDQVTQQNAALVEEGAAAATSLKLQAQQLVESVAVFKLAATRSAGAVMSGIPLSNGPVLRLSKQ